MADSSAIIPKSGRASSVLSVAIVSARSFIAVLIVAAPSRKQPRYAGRLMHDDVTCGKT